MEIFDGSTASVNYNYVFSSIPAARNKYTGLGRSTAPAVLLVVFAVRLANTFESLSISYGRHASLLTRAE